MSEEIELTSKYIVLEIPEDSVAVTITATVYHEGKLQDVRKSLTMQEVREAFKEAEDGYIPSDATFQITDLGRAYLDHLAETRGMLDD
jgi:hypothetical protein